MLQIRPTGDSTMTKAVRTDKKLLNVFLFEKIFQKSLGLTGIILIIILIVHFYYSYNYFITFN